MAQYKIGTATFTNGSATVTGTGTEWLANVSIGDWIIRRGSPGVSYPVYRVGGIVSDTEITLTAPYGGVTASDVNYTVHISFLPNGTPELENGDVESASIQNEANANIPKGIGTEPDQVPTNADLYVDSLEDLPNPVVVGQRVAFHSYYPGWALSGDGLPKGGGVVVGVASGVHDGGTKFDPTRSADIGTAAYYNTEPSAAVWVRENSKLHVDNFGAVPHPLTESSPSNSKNAIDKCIEIANTTESTIYFGDGIYGYDSNEYVEITNGITFEGTGDHSSRIFFSGTGGTYRVGTHSNFYFWHSKVGRRLTVKDMEWRQVDTNYVAAIYSCSANDDFGMEFTSESSIFSLWQNTGVHIIRGFGVNLIDSAFIGTSSYTESSGTSAFALDDANIRIWGADGTTETQEHSFSDNVSIINCKLNKAKYQIDGYGVIGEAVSTSIEKGYAGIKNVKVSGPVAPSSDTAKAGGGKAALSIGTGCYFEKQAVYYAIDREINESTGAEIDPGEVGADYYFNGTDPSRGGPVEDASFVGIARHNPELEIKRLSLNGRNYLGDQGGSLVDSSVSFWSVFQENPSKTFIDVNKDLARFSMPSRFDGDMDYRNAGGTATIGTVTEASGGGWELNSTNEINLNGSVAGVTVRGSGQFRPTTDNTQDLGDASFRWGTVYAGTGTINTSDEREKTELLSIDESETAAAVDIKAAIKKFKFTDAVDAKGEKARVHFGVGAQTVKSILERNGLDPFDYAFMCYDEWDDEWGDVVIKPGIYNDACDTLVEPVVEKRLIRKKGDRYGIRYDELAMFILAAI